MSATIKRYGMTTVRHFPVMAECADGFFVERADHIASHAYDEEKERALFEAEYKVGPSAVRYDINTRQYVTDWPSRETLDLAWRANILLEGWLQCAKSRAKAAGCE